MANNIRKYMLQMIKYINKCNNKKSNKNGKRNIRIKP